MRIILIQLFFLCSVYSGYAQNLYLLPTDNQLKTKIDTIIHINVSEIFNDSLSVGMSFGITFHNKAHFYNYGTTEKGKQQLPNENTIYEIGSITKTFTGILLANAVVENKINLEDDIRNYLTGDYSNLQYNGKPIKIKDLANHTSGLPEDIIPEKILSLKNPTMFDIINVFEGDSGTIFKENLQKVKLDTLPGTRMIYSNAGMITLGIILENIYQKSYVNLLKYYITEPLGMDNTEIVYYKSDTVSYTKGYDRNGNIMPHITFQIAGAAGGIKSTTSNLIKYIEENIERKDEAIKLSHKKFFGNSQHLIGLGWHIKPTSKDGVELWHDGGEPGFSSYIVIIPDSNIGIICLANQRGRQYQFSKFSKAVIDSLIEL